MKCLRTALLVIFLICVVPFQTNASFLEIFRKLAEGRQDSEITHQMPPSPSPVPAAAMSSGNAQSHVNLPKEETCDMVSNKCDIKDYSVTACVPFVGNGSQASYVLVLNGGESSLRLNMTLRPANVTLVEDIEISGHQVKKVNLPSETGGNSSILLNVGDGHCIIQIGASIPQNFYTSYLTPINGTYLLFLTALFIGGIWACCKLGERRRHLNGVQYRELEMGQQESDPSFQTETPEGWEQNWDDDWDEEKAARPPGARKVLQNGAPLRYIDTTQWGNDWDD